LVPERVELKMTYEEDKKDLARHEREIAARESFNYATFHREETALLGCVYVDPPDPRSPAGSDASSPGGSSTTPSASSSPAG